MFFNHLLAVNSIVTVPTRPDIMQDAISKFSIKYYKDTILPV